MKNTEDQMFSSSTPTDSQETQLSLQDALNLLGMKEVPGGEADAGLILSGTNRLMQTYGKDWIIANRVRLVEELQILAEL